MCATWASWCVYPSRSCAQGRLNFTVIRGNRRGDLDFFKTNLEMITTQKKIGQLPRLHKTNQTQILKAYYILCFKLRKMSKDRHNVRVFLIVIMDVSERDMPS